jgi:hypothetical protein
MKPNASTTGGQAYMGGISAPNGGGGGVNPYSLTGGG